MYFLALPSVIASGENKGKPNTVDITNTVLNENEKTKFVIPAQEFTYPQFGVDPRYTEEVDGKPVEKVRDLTDDEAQQGIDEFVTSCGGKVRALEVINDATSTAALNRGKAKIRTAQNGSKEAIVEEGLKTSREFNWQQVQRQTVASIKETVSSIKDKVAQAGGLENLSPEELKEALALLMK